MIERTQKLVKDLEKIMPILPGPIVTTVTVLQVASVACEVIGTIHDEVKRWDWPW
jgi:fructose-specific phosphotransferase system IIC component